MNPARHCLIAWMAASCWMGVLRTEVKAADGVFRFESPAYTIAIGPDGNVRSLVVGGTPILDAGPDGKSGAFFLDEKDAVVGFSRVETRDRSNLICREGGAEVRYTFLPDRIEIRRTNAGSRYANWAWLPSRHVARSLDARYDYAVDLAKPPFDGYQADARWLTRSGVVVHMPYVTWIRKEKVAPGRNVAILSHAFGEGDEKPFVIRLILAPRTEDALAFDIHCENPNFLVPGGKTELFAVRVDNASTNPVDAVARFRVLTYLERKPVASVDMPIKLVGGQSQPLPLTAALKEPSVYRAELTVRDGDKELRKLEWVFVYDWEHWKAPLHRPADFAEFWRKTLVELRSRPLDPVVTPQPDQNGLKICRVNFRSLGEGRVYGWYVTPPGDGPFPAVLMLPGNGVYKMGILRWPAGRYAILIMQVHGYDVDLSNYPAAPNPPPWEGGNYWAVWKSRDEAFARVVYANCTRAVDFLMSRPEIAKDAVCVDGGSQGGGLSIVTAALNPTLKSACVSFPGLCRLDWAYGHFLDAPFPWNGKSPKPAGVSNEEFLRIMSYYDAANFAPDIHCPVTGLIALQDNITMGGNGLAALRNLKTPLALVNGVWTNHRSDEGTARAYTGWLKKNLMEQSP